MPVEVIENSSQTFDLQMVITIICATIGVAVYSVLIWSLIKYRNSSSAQSAPFHENTVTEIIWTVIPILILIMMAIPSIHGIA